MTIGVSVTNEEGCIERVYSYDNIDEAFEAIDILEDFEYVTEERPAILSYGSYTVEVRPDKGVDWTTGRVGWSARKTKRL